MDRNNTLIKRLLNLKEDYTLDLNEGEDKDTLKVAAGKESSKDSPQEILLAKVMAQFISGDLSAEEFLQKEKEIKSMESLEEEDLDSEKDPDEGEDNETSDYTDGEENEEDSSENEKEVKEEPSEEANSDSEDSEASITDTDEAPQEGETDVAPKSTTDLPREVTLEGVTKDIETLSLEDKSKLLIDLYNRGGDKLKDAIHRQISSEGKNSKVIEDMYHAMQGGTAEASLRRAYDSFVNSKNNTSRIATMADMFEAIHAAAIEDEAAKPEETSKPEVAPSEEKPENETSGEESTSNETSEE